MKKAIQNNKTYTLSIYNHAAGCFETVEVTEEVYRTYQRTEWNIEDNDTSFYAHEIQFSSLIGGSEDAFQNFREFIDTENTPENIMEEIILHENLLQAIASLTEKERAIIQAIYFEGLTATEYARQCGVSQPAISQMKQRILKKIKKFLI
jgi:RNA polymerase sigma factor (sigma-70 family)